MMKSIKSSVAWKNMILPVLTLILLACSLDPMQHLNTEELSTQPPANSVDDSNSSDAAIGGNMPAGRVEQEAFAFDYDTGWQPFFDGELPGMVDVRLDVETLGAVVETGQSVETPLRPFYSNAVVIMRKAIPEGSSLEEVYRETYAAQTLAYPDAAKDGIGQLSGLPALERTYPFFSGEPRYDIRELWVERDGWAYILSQRAQYTSQVNLDRPGFKTIEESFQFTN
jgi:hypothetical protein